MSISILPKTSYYYYIFELNREKTELRVLSLQTLHNPALKDIRNAASPGKRPNIEMKEMVIMITIQI